MAAGALQLKRRCAMWTRSRAAAANACLVSSPAPRGAYAQRPSGEDLARTLSHPAITLFVAGSAGAIVGMLTPVSFPLPTGLQARIEDVAVDRAAPHAGGASAPHSRWRPGTWRGSGARAAST